MIKNLFTFHGGVHPPQNKQTAHLGIEEMPLPKKVVLPVLQHIGAPAKPLVIKGDVVVAGQKIAEATGHISSPVHASISGTVTDIIPWLHPVIGKPVDSIVIESDGVDEKVKVSNVYSDYYRYSPKDLIALVKDMGIVGLGGATFPTHVKLAPPKDTEIDTIIINGAECEPYLTSDDRLMKEHPKEVVEGAKIIMYMLNAIHCVIALEDNKPDAISAISKIVFNEPNIDIVVLKTRYPQGAEKQLIKTVTNREVPSGGLPLHVGVVVQNVATAYAISRVIKEGEPLTSRIVTVSGKGIREPKNIKARIGTLLSDVAEFCGGVTDDLSQLIMGGPMMGLAQPTLHIPVLKGTSGVLFLSAAEVKDNSYVDCFRCGKCTRACPMKLYPNLLSIYIEKGRIEDSRMFYPLDCIECGCCAYVCPARRPIVQQIKWAKAQLAKK